MVCTAPSLSRGFEDSPHPYQVHHGSAGGRRGVSFTWMWGTAGSSRPHPAQFIAVGVDYWCQTPVGHLTYRSYVPLCLVVHPALPLRGDAPYQPRVGLKQHNR